MTWASDAQQYIHEIVLTLPADHTYEDCRAALRKHSHAFTGGTSWGKKIWPRECRKYLAMTFSQHVRAVSGAERIRRDDIVFPFRNKKD